MSGLELADELKKRRPEMKVLFTSGYPAPSEGRAGLRPGENYLPKPFGPDVLIARVRDVLTGMS